MVCLGAIFGGMRRGRELCLLLSFSAFRRRALNSGTRRPSLLPVIFAAIIQVQVQVQVRFMVPLTPPSGNKYGHLLKTIYLAKREAIEQLRASSEDSAKFSRFQAEIASLSEEEAKIYGGLCLKAVAYESSVVFWVAHSKIEGPVFGWVDLDAASPELKVVPIPPERESQVAEAITRGDNFDSIATQFFPPHRE